jgi:hypothetical protein
MKQIIVLLIAFCLIAFCVFAAGPVLAQTKISPAKTNQYIQSCLKNSEADTSTNANTKTIFCQCTAQFMQRNLTMEDLKAMGGKGQTQRNAMNKMVTGVYAPCMEFPVRDMIQKQCMTDVKQPPVCQCLSKNMAAYTAKSAQTTLGKVLAKTPNAFDPMGAIIDSPEFQAQQKQITMQCLTGKLK